MGQIPTSLFAIKKHPYTSDVYNSFTALDGQELGRSIKTLLPITKSLLMPKTAQPKIAKSQLKECQQAQAKCYDTTAKDSQKMS